MIEPVQRRRRRARRSRSWLLAVVIVAVVVGGVFGAALLAWPSPGLGRSDETLARVDLPGFAGSVTGVRVLSSDGRRVPVRLVHGSLRPRHRLAGGELLTVELTARRPGWAAWLVGKTEHRTLKLETPAAHLLGRWLQVRRGAPVEIAFDKPVSRVSLGGRDVQLKSPSSVVPVGIVARGASVAGVVAVSAAVHPWEQLSAPVRVSWFPARPLPQLLAEPRAGSEIGLQRQLTLTFSRPVEDVLGSRRPQVMPRTPGHWRLLDAHTLTFRPSGFGFGVGETVRADLPRSVLLAGGPRMKLAHRVEWHVRTGSIVRLHQLLAQLGYIPLDWQPANDPAPTLATQLSEAVTPPAGRFSWRYSNTPRELRRLWDPKRENDITRGAVMVFEATHGLDPDGFAGPHVWRRLLADALAGKHRDDGYSFVYVHQAVPQSLNLWHNGRVIVSSPGNTGIPSAPTKNGTFAVYEHIPVGTMSGTNPDGTRYHDTGIRYISYFNGGDAIHAFNRASFGTPQSLGCVELPLAAAAQVWPYTPIGTLVTIEA